MIVILLEPCKYRVPRGFLNPSPKKNDCVVNCCYSRYAAKQVRSRPIRVEKESVKPVLFGKLNGYIRYYSGTPSTIRVHD